MTNIALTVSLLSLVAVIGLWIGNWQIKGIGLGIGGVLFGGILVGHFADQFHLTLNTQILHFIQEFGLILFVYTIGIQVGPGFFSSLKKSGLRLNALACLLVILGGIITALLHVLLDIPLPIILGIFSGAVTNTPSLGAGQQILADLQANESLINQMGMAYAMAYPFGICGILLSMWLIRFIFHININHEAKDFDSKQNLASHRIKTLTLEITQSHFNHLTINDIPVLNEPGIICSRIKRGGSLLLAKPTQRLEIGDRLHLVGLPLQLKNAVQILGQEVDDTLNCLNSDLQMTRLVVTNEQVFGKKIQELNLSQYDVVISRHNRAGVELIANGNTQLHFGDIVNLVGKTESIDLVSNLLGNAEQKLQQVQMLPVFIGIGLGVLLGSIPLFIPGFPAPLRLGLAGGPLVIALILGRIGSVGKLSWFMPPSANLALRELGIVLFLAVVGFKSGASFVQTLLNGDGLLWMAYGIVITIIPLLVVGILARLILQLNYLSLCGLLAGSMTDPPALAFANAMHHQSGAAALAYATVYPLVMFLRIISPQLLVLIFWL